MHIWSGPVLSDSKTCKWMTIFLDLDVAVWGFNVHQKDGNPAYKKYMQAHIFASLKKITINVPFNHELSSGDSPRTGPAHLLLNLVAMVKPNKKAKTKHISENQNDRLLIDIERNLSAKERIQSIRYKSREALCSKSNCKNQQK